MILITCLLVTVRPPSAAQTFFPADFSARCRRNYRRRRRKSGPRRDADSRATSADRTHSRSRDTAAAAMTSSPPARHAQSGSQGCRRVVDDGRTRRFAVSAARKSAHVNPPRVIADSLSMTGCSPPENGK